MSSQNQEVEYSKVNNVEAMKQKIKFMHVPNWNLAGLIKILKVKDLGGHEIP